MHDNSKPACHPACNQVRNGGGTIQNMGFRTVSDERWCPRQMEYTKWFFMLRSPADHGQQKMTCNNFMSSVNSHVVKHCTPDSFSNAWSNKVKRFIKYILCRTPHVLPWLFFWIRMYTIAQGLGIMPNKYLEQVIPCDSWKYFTLYQLHVSRWCSESQSGWGSPASE